MTDNITPLTTEHLRLMREEMTDFRAEMRAGFVKMVAEFDDMRKRFRTQEHHVVGLRRDEAVASEEITDLRHQIDGLPKRLSTLEDRAPH